MRKINFKKLKAGELVEVPRYCFAPLRRDWNGWLFSPAVVLTKGISKKSGKEVVKVKMMIPRGTNEYSTVEKTFYSDCVFIYTSVDTAKHFMEELDVHSKEEFYDKIIEHEGAVGSDWIRFLIDEGFLFNESEAQA